MSVQTEESIELPEKNGAQDEMVTDNDGQIEEEGEISSYYIVMDLENGQINSMEVTLVEKDEYY